MTRRRDSAPSQRQLRVGEELRHALVRILGREQLRDPAMQGVQTTVTEVRMSPDLRNATVFVMPFAGGDGGQIVAALNRAAGFLRAQLAHEVRLRYAPGIRFALDDSFSQAQRIDELLHDPRVVRDLAQDGPPADESKPGTDDGRGG